jgi:hypothetical protein
MLHYAANALRQTRSRTRLSQLLGAELKPPVLLWRVARCEIVI